MLLSLALPSCRRAQKDPRIAENAEPHVVVRVIDRAAETQCDDDGLMTTLACRLARAQRIGCVYAETGDDLATPLTRERREPFDCNSLGGTNRVVVAQQPLRHVKLFTDERRERVLLRAGEAEWLFLFFNGALLDARVLRAESAATGSVFRADGSAEWALVPSLLDVVPAHLDRFSDDDLDALTRATPDGAARLEAAAVAAFGRRDITPDSAGWSRLYERLPAARREEIQREVLRSIEEGEVDAIAWAQRLPMPREPLIAALVATLADDGAGASELPEAFNLLGRLAPERLAPLACHQLEKAWFDGVEADLSMNTVALAVIARQRLRCPWVEPWLSRHACSWPLREEREDAPLPIAPLVSEKTRRRAIEVELSMDTDEDADGTSLEGPYGDEPWGPLLLAAGAAQGALPRDFELKNARRLYRRVYLEKDDAHDLCRDADDDVSDWVCELPVSMRELHHRGCVITLDDAQRVMQLQLER